MGLLDDAIREHLELKRARGADLAEVARQEDEALGDPRSGEFVKPEGTPEPVADEPVADEPAAPPTEAVPVEEQLPPEPPAPYEPEPEPEAGPEPEPEPPPAPRDEAWLPDEPVNPVASQPTAEFTPPEVEPAPEVVRPDEEPGADEDVLEETPDFLQETPEHDRLWFEQKPPRDFDFDK
jgi:hypothetical protein